MESLRGYDEWKTTEPDWGNEPDEPSDAEDDDDDREPPESGPFCRRYAEPSECKELCRCGRECREHGGEECGHRYGPDGRPVEPCECEGFADAEENQ